MNAWPNMPRLLRLFPALTACKTEPRKDVPVEPPNDTARVVPLRPRPAPALPRDDDPPPNRAA